ncbi:acyl carrier protein [uncultured Thiohalocapsa sp.]|uniref:acyl carrier protein n=1 Tax=uncultured Thiohalocapsa sp. TaxID=768990 RepID=UPI002600940E|nr:acyl carrier protein [uncultured Thiohalocapsa sp.]
MTSNSLSREALQAIALEALTQVAPDLAEETIPPDADLREAYDLDSMDLLNWINALHKRLGVDIPEQDYPRLASLGAAADYLHRATRAG